MVWWSLEEVSGCQSIVRIETDVKRLGLPIYDQGGFLLGGIGVSGGTVAQDIQVAQAGVDALPACSC